MKECKDLHWKHLSFHDQFKVLGAAEEHAEEEVQGGAWVATRVQYVVAHKPVGGFLSCCLSGPHKTKHAVHLLQQSPEQGLETLFY